MKKLTGFVVFFYMLPMLAWWLVLGVYNGGEISLENADWGYFGSFVGGVLSPLFALLSIVFLYFSIKESERNHLSQLGVLQAQNRREQFVKLVGFYNSKLAEPLDQQFSGIINKYKSSKLKYNIYTDGSKEISFPDGTVRDVIFEFYMSKDSGKRHTKSYIDLVGSLAANAELCFCKILDLIIKIEDDQEFEETVDLVEALSEFHSTIGLMEFSLSTVMYSPSSPLLERLVLINSRTHFKKEIVAKYLKVKEAKANEDKCS